MGMFDYVRCEVPLPDGFTGQLQTKDFLCNMITIVITAEGRLIDDNGYSVEVPKEERPYPNAEPDTIESFCGIIRWVSVPEDANYHGWFNFYGSSPEGWHEYRAKFTDGQLVKIEVLSSPTYLVQSSKEE